jgi:hypothetical protein
MPSARLWTDDGGMDAIATGFGVEVAAPDGAAALDLEGRLWQLEPAAISRDGHWFVEFPGSVDREQIERVVCHWLRDLGEPTTTMRLDGDEIVVNRERRRRQTNGDFIG